MKRRPIRYRKGLQQRHPLALFGLLRAIARSIEIANQMAAPNQPGPVTVVMGPGFEIEPQRAPGPMWPLESADRSRVRVVVASKTLRNARVRSADQCTSGNERE